MLEWITLIVGIAALLCVVFVFIIVRTICDQLDDMLGEKIKRRQAADDDWGN